MKGKSHHHDRDGVGDARRTEAQDVCCASSGCLHCYLSLVFLQRRDCIIYLCKLCRCAAVLAFQTRRRLRGSAPHLSFGVAACLTGADGGAGACIGNGCCSGRIWLGGWVGCGGGTRLVLIPCLYIRVASARSTIVRAAIPFLGSTVAALNQSSNGATCWVIPMASDFECIMCHRVAGARKGDTISTWTRERGGAGTPGVLRPCLVLGSPGLFEGARGARCDNRASMSAAQGTVTSPRVSHSSFNTTVAGRRPRWTSLAKARTFLSYSVGCTKDGVTN